MERMTDTEIRICYERAVSTLQAVEGKSDPASQSLVHDMRRELRNLRARWDAVLAMKRDGHITDPARVNAVRKEVTVSAKLAGLRIRVTIEPYKIEGLEPPPFHHVVAYRIGAMTEAEERRWVRWTELVSNALDVFPFVLPAHFGRMRYFWELTLEQRAHAERKAQEICALFVEWADESDEDESFEEEDEDCDEAEADSASARWAVDTWVWNWPDTGNEDCGAKRGRPHPSRHATPLVLGSVSQQGRWLNR
jgi:hypothetical protein